MFERPLEDLIGEFIPRPGPPRRQIPHVLEDGVEDEAGLLTQLVLVEQFLQQGKLDGFAAVAPQVVAAALASAGIRKVHIFSGFEVLLGSLGKN